MGMGLGASRQKFGWLPEQTTDAIGAVWGQVVTQAGAFGSVEAVKHTQAQGHWTELVTCRFAKASAGAMFTRFELLIKLVVVRKAASIPAGVAGPGTFMAALLVLSADMTKDELPMTNDQRMTNDQGRMTKDE